MEYVGKTEIIGTDSPVEARPKDLTQFSDPVRRSRKYGTFRDSQFLARRREKRYAREVHSDGFLAISRPAVECDCGGCAIWQDGYVCPRCGKAND